MGLMLRRMCMMGASAIPTPPLIKTVSGALLHITDALAKPLKKLVVNLEPVQSGSGDPAPDNVRPITGWTGCNVRVVGENLIPTPSNFALNGYNSTVGNSDILAALGSLKAGKTYRSSCNGTYRDSGDEFHALNLMITYNDNSTVTIRGTSQTGSVKNLPIKSVNFYSGSNSILGYRDISRLGLVMGTTLPSSIPTYEPNSTTIPITFPDAAGTVYGGTLTINEDGSGVLSSSFIKKAIADFSWNYRGNNVFRSTAEFVAPESNYSVTTARSNIYNAVSSSAFGDDCAFSVDSSGRVQLKDTAYETVASLTAGRSECYFVGELAEPITYQLTSQQVLTLLQGENNVWSNSDGELELTYLAKAEETTP